MYLNATHHNISMIEMIETTAKDTAQQEATLFLQEPLSIKPSIAEAERFIQFLNKRFDLGVRDDLLILIHETRPNIKGFFRGGGWYQANSENSPFKRQQSNTQNIKQITLSSHTLTDTPYETLAHELAHYVSNIRGVQDCSKNGRYHNKKFKVQAEALLLKVENCGSYGFAFTSETEAFKDMVKEFEPNNEAFKIFQNVGEPKEKPKSRMLLFVCGCGCKIRTAKNVEKPLKALCQYCGYGFEECEE